jgi:hypothetical protein
VGRLCFGPPFPSGCINVDIGERPIFLEAKAVDAVKVTRSDDVGFEEALQAPAVSRQR